MYTRSLRRLFASVAVFWPLASVALAAAPDGIGPLPNPSVIHRVQTADDRLEMVIHTSRILTTDRKIVQIEPGNRDILDMTTLSPNQIQITGKAMGMTQVNIWDEDKKLYTISVLVVGDTRELALKLRTAFPGCPLKVTPVASAVMISGTVDKNEYIDQIIRIAEEYYPKVINGMTVSGGQQVLLHVKVMEVSRTKLRELGFDWAKITGTNIVTSGPNTMLTDYNPGAITTPPNLFRTASPSTFAFNVGGPGAAFFGVLNAMRDDNLAKILSEPTLVAISGQEASFNSGGQIPVPTPQSLGTLSITWQKYGTQIKFLPIVRGNGRIWLQVQPLISSLDAATGTLIAGTRVPGIKSRDASTAVEMMAGQTLAIAGLVQTEIESETNGIPWVSDVPYLGAAFRHVKEQRNEVELLILVTPELAEPLDSCEVPPCGPGMATTSPSDWELYLKAHLEVPKCAPCPAYGNGCGSPGGPGGSAGNESCAPPSDGIIGSPEQVPTPRPSIDDSRSKPNSRYSPTKPDSTASPASSKSPEGPPGFIGPAGYDVVK
jgi:pilus assembly protein CpaC